MPSTESSVTLKMRYDNPNSYYPHHPPLKQQQQNQTCVTSLLAKAIKSDIQKRNRQAKATEQHLTSIERELRRLPSHSSAAVTKRRFIKNNFPITLLSQSGALTPQKNSSLQSSNSSSEHKLSTQQRLSPCECDESRTLLKHLPKHLRRISRS